MTPDYFNDQLEDNATILQPNEGETFSMNGLSLTFKVTSELSNDELGVYKIKLAPMAIGAKLHYHRFMDETFIVDKGTLTIQVADKEYTAKAGTIAYVPRFTPHGFKNDTNEEVELTLLFNPSQKREGFFRGLHETLGEVPINPEKYLKLYNKYDSFPVDTSNMIPVRT
ncbi:cupin domain-containing protein [Seonamhaeicola marinus]|uniref:Cupin domain-containing protein n=1 Tax=Seonamhaeicola marinus TaxID=1912246 RepID=A0A5D0IQV0_9FLAO|nr:cupin domain-containing protein [Seonamhaeicola marinus]TYA84092.1 cupin domain-containing protein [Seonamhaeicola marinus]